MHKNTQIYKFFVSHFFLFCSVSVHVLYLSYIFERHIYLGVGFTLYVLIVLVLFLLYSFESLMVKLIVILDIVQLFNDYLVFIDEFVYFVYFFFDIFKRFYFRFNPRFYHDLGRSKQTGDLELLNALLKCLETAYLRQRQFMVLEGVKFIVYYFYNNSLILRFLYYGRAGD